MSQSALPVTFFGYWAGPLPAVTDLHFRSFLRHHPGSRHDLWLDTDVPSGIAAPELQWIKSHPRLQVRRFSLNELIERHVSAKPVPRYDRHALARQVARALHRRLAPKRAHGAAWWHAQFGRAYKHSSMLFGGFTRDKVYRSDLARCLIALEHYPNACLYADLDVCFASDLTTQCGDRAWAYRWEKLQFADPALLYLPDRSWSAALTRRGNELETFLPWVLFADAVCAELGVVVHPNRLFDPLRDSTSLLYGDSDRFFGPRDNLALDLHALARERHLAIHWHENWKTVPARTSIYAGLLKACEGATA